MQRKIETIWTIIVIPILLMIAFGTGLAGLEIAHPVIIVISIIYGVFIGGVIVFFVHTELKDE